MPLVPTGYDRFRLVLTGCDRLGRVGTFRNPPKPHTTVRSLSLSEAARGRDAAAFGDLVGRPGGDGFHFITHAARPLDDEAVGLRVGTEAERDGQLGLREIARAGLHEPPVLVATGENADARADAVAIRLHAAQLHAERVTAGRRIHTVKERGPVVRRDDDVRVAVVVE